MLEEGCSTDVVDCGGWTVYRAAAEVVRMLVCKGCDVNVMKVNGCTPLHCAASCGRTAAVRQLI